MSTAYDRGYSDYNDQKRCLVRRDVRGRLHWDSNPDTGGLPDVEAQREFADAYIAGYTQACKDDDRDVPMASKERLRR